MNTNADAPGQETASGLNTRIDLEYADEGNNKQSLAVVVSGAITDQQMQRMSTNLADGDMGIIAHQVGLPTPAELNNDFPTEEDHVFTRLVLVEESQAENLHTEVAPTHDIDIETLTQRIESTEWDILAEMERMELDECGPQPELSMG